MTTATARTTSDFPTAQWGASLATFHPGETPPDGTPVYAALVFAMQSEQFVVANILGRGLCIPGGRLEPGETPLEALHREVCEEIGGTIAEPIFLGHYRLSDPKRAPQFVMIYLADVASLFEQPTGSESLGVEFLTREEMPDRYFSWDPLLEAVIDYALAVRQQTQVESSRRIIE